MTAQIHGCPQVDSPASPQPAQLILDVRQAKEPDMCIRLELNQDVDIAGFGKTIGKNRAEEGELTDTVTLAYLSDLRLRDLDVCDRHGLFSIAHACCGCMARSSAYRSPASWCPVS